jgi:hypothetical protein
LALYLFADTNVFLQCKPVQELKWDAFGTWERIELVITRPVQTEIDALKDGGNARRSARARLASALIDELLETEGSRMELRAQPPVHLTLRHDLRRDESASDVLDYAERDDQLVGTALKFLRSQPDGAVRLLTNDTGPKASAKAVGLEYVAIPLDWLIAPELDETERQLNRLRAENERLRGQEPAVELEALPPFHVKVESALQVYRPLAASESDALLAELTTRFPLATDFGPTQAQERVLDTPGMSTLLAQRKERFEPASAEQIAEYKAEYEKWTESCRTLLIGLPKMLNRQTVWPRLTVRIKNAGTRPAEAALVTLTVTGKLYLMPPRRQNDEADEKKADGPMPLPRAPAAPKGTWRRVDLFSNLPSAAMRDVFAGASYLGLDTVRPVLPYMPEPRDPNDFYFKQGRRGRPAQVISYECAQWRHAGAPEDFEIDVLCPAKPGKHGGLITVTVQAANLSEPAELRLPVSIQVQEVSCVDEAGALVAGVR